MKSIFLLRRKVAGHVRQSDRFQPALVQTTSEDHSLNAQPEKYRYFWLSLKRKVGLNGDELEI